MGVGEISGQPVLRRGRLCPMFKSATRRVYGRSERRGDFGHDGSPKRSAACKVLEGDRQISAKTSQHDPDGSKNVHHSLLESRSSANGSIRECAEKADRKARQEKAGMDGDEKISAKTSQHDPGVTRRRFLQMESNSSAARLTAGHRRRHRLWMRGRP